MLEQRLAEIDPVRQLDQAPPQVMIQVLIVALGLGGLVVLAGRRRWWALVAMATPIALVTLVGAATLAASRRNEVLMTLVFPLAGVTLAWAGAALSSSGPWSRQTSSHQS